MRKVPRLFLWTVAGWLFAFSAWTVWHLYTYTPPALDRDYYTHNWGFQLIVVIVFHLPVWIIGLLVVICVEMLVFKRRL